MNERTVCIHSVKYTPMPSFLGLIVVEMQYWASCVEGLKSGQGVHRNTSASKMDSYYICHKITYNTKSLCNPIYNYGTIKKQEITYRVSNSGQWAKRTHTLDQVLQMPCNQGMRDVENMWAIWTQKHWAKATLRTDIQASPLFYAGPMAHHHPTLD